ncbi:MAG TPA: bifunctional UDP-N-acetylglucosamine diphosphorylase/glucosamine-1-phosphate N-acetyltransferase GlmU [Syntrophorhabdales bacterium]|nr:bifunctional UDP-N-acetylglucosamine diphosphorylase/glucosamine-1-phosphate N-acetyltransferase GlmU [Syntrophorhabdales bacterium]
MPQPTIVILAAGKGKRMRSRKPKVLHEIMGRPMIECVVEAARQLSPSKIVVVTGHERELVEERLKNGELFFAAQEEQKGTAHALLVAEPMLDATDILILYGDVPLIKPETLQAFIQFFRSSQGVAFMTTEVDDPAGYGRVITDGDVIRDIVEDADADASQKKIREINTGICMLKKEMLPLVREIKNDNAKNEYYLTDICKVARTRGITVRGYHYNDPQEVLGINTRKELLNANQIMRERILAQHMDNGVTLAGEGIYIESDVRIGQDTVIFPFCFLRGKTIVGEGVTIGPHVVINNSVIGDGVTVEPFCSLDGLTAEAAVAIGPFARIRPTTVLKERVKIGNFVEVKNSVIQPKSKANHLSYIGDADIGTDVNVGAGTITCNYDGRKKYRTTIEDGVFVGSNTELVAPVKIGKDATIGAGSTITRDVPEGALAVTRVKQKHIEGYARRKK